MERHRHYGGEMKHKLITTKCLVCKWRGMFCIKGDCHFTLRKLDEVLMADKIKGFDLISVKEYVRSTMREGKK